ncbi:hypothetical protein OEZ85_002536 [Tetradesmus obliquus]|uniref:EGF-like domain-containing protein n=1 Tax=Tetradesmus obliquus TaxID=3088 RepID=A0ABY8U2R0_TETOB|nr:hypothetical protein OEZ85_002536 [Tetradesmus obliquus]
MIGEMMLGQLFESCRDWLNDHNWPEGPCIFCLEELCPAGSSSSSDQPYMRLPCFHAFHQNCFGDWWCWQQQALSEQQQQLEQRTGATAAAALAQEQAVKGASLTGEARREVIDDAVSGQCNNRRRDGSETDVDCGGEECSRRCALRQSCRVGSDCITGTCDADSRKCGCPGGLTLAPGTLTCYSEQSTCYNSRKDGKETDIDCGGPCVAAGKRCRLFARCLQDADCQSNSCSRSNLTCACPPGFIPQQNNTGCRPVVISKNDPCWNGVRDNDETDTDCGGSTCWKCSNGFSCKQASDCSSSNCDTKSKKCSCPAGSKATPSGLCLTPEAAATGNGTCFNGKFDQGLETDVDCGLTCAKGCSFGHACKKSSDCAPVNSVCNSDQRICMCPRGQFVSPDNSACLTADQLCFNGAKDAEESDVDCGGSCSTKCKFGQFCNVPSDCETGVCVSTTTTTTSGSTSSTSSSSKTCGCPSRAPLSKDGKKCTTRCDTAPNPCRNGGTCLPNFVVANASANFNCSCPLNVVGGLCETRLSTCNVSNPCRNGGACIPMPDYTPGKGGPDFRCYCQAGYSGAMNGGSCMPRPGGVPDYTCTCPTTFTGPLCQDKANTCSILNPCINRGACMPLPGAAPDFRCSCSGGFAGMLCEIDCYAKQQSGKCDCSPGYQTRDGVTCVPKV